MAASSPLGTGLEHYRSIQLLTEMPAPAPIEEIPEAAELTAEEAAALDFLQKDTEADARHRSLKLRLGRCSAWLKIKPNGAPQSPGAVFVSGTSAQLSFRNSLLRFDC